MSDPIEDENDAAGREGQNNNDNTVATGQGEVDSAPTMEQNDNVPDWNYSVNWPYVVISRVRSLRGLFIGKKLDPTKDYSVPVELQRLMRFFHSYKKPASFDSALLNLDTPV